MIDKKISIIFPTCNRFKYATQAIRGLYETTKHLNIELILVVDGDKKTADELENYLSDKKTDKWNYIIDYSTTRRGAIESWNYGLSLSTGEILFPSADDSIYYENWLDNALEFHEEFLDGHGMVALNDKIWNGNVLGTTLLYDRDFCIKYLGGVCAYPVYNYFYIDNELNERAKLAGKYVWCPEAIVEHIHPDVGKRPRDELDMERNQNNYNFLDKQIFERRKASGFPNDFKAVIGPGSRV